MPRLLFEKTGNAVWISHLDLMRLFQRAFKRAQLPLSHTQGFNPRPSISILLPLSVGVQSHCEMLDFDLDGMEVSCNEICKRLNAVLVDGIRVLQVYEQGKKGKELKHLDCTVTLEYDAGVPAGAADAVARLFQRENILLEKRSKNGVTEQDIIPMIRTLAVQEEADSLVIRARICCQDPALNPMQLSTAVQKYLPEFVSDAAKCCRLEVYDGNQELFR